MKSPLFIKIASTLCLLALMPLPAAQANDARSHIMKGNDFVARRDYKRALKEYEEAEKADPKNAGAFLLAGLTYSGLGDFDNALKATQQSIDIEPSYNAYHNLGLIYANRSDFPKSIAAYEKAIELNPTAYRTWYQMGLVYTASGDFSKAIEKFRKSIELNPRYEDAYLGLGSAYYWSGDVQSARDQALHLRSINSDKALALQEWIENKERKKGVAAPSAKTTEPSGKS